MFWLAVCFCLKKTIGISKNTKTVQNISRVCENLQFNNIN